MGTQLKFLTLFVENLSNVPVAKFITILDNELLFSTGFFLD